MTKRPVYIILCLLLLGYILIFPASLLMAQFSIGPGGWVTVKAGGSMMIGTDVHIKSVAGASGYLVDQNVNGDIDITGDVTVDRYMTGNEWHNVSSPVSDETSSIYTGTDLVFWYNEALILNDWNFGWVWYSGATGGPLMEFRGYDVYFVNNSITISYQATGTETLNTGPYSITVINTSSTPGEIPSHKGWNLLGNPYPSPVDWLAASGWNKASINDAKYIWDGANDIYTIFVGGGSPYGLNGGTRFIPSNQGFWVQSVVASGTVSINNATRVGDITGTPDFYKTDPVDYPVVCLLASGNQRQDEAVIRFIEGTTPGFDLNFDATKLFSPSESVPQVSIVQSKQVFALNTLPGITDNLEIKLGFQCGTSGYYSLSMTERTHLDLFTRVYLKDELLQKVVPFSIGSPYHFYHSVQNKKDRFKLYFNPSDDIINNISPGNWFSIYTRGNLIKVVKNTSNSVSGNILVYNLLGQPILTESLNDENELEIRTDLPSGNYIVVIITDQSIYTEKVVIIN